MQFSGFILKSIKHKCNLLNVTSKYKWKQSDGDRERKERQRLENAIVDGFEDRERGQEGRNTGGYKAVKVRKQISPRPSRRN